MASENLKIYGIKTNKGYYISLNPSDSYQTWDRLEGRLFDGKLSEPSFQKCWRFVGQKPTKVSHIEKQPNTNYRFVLKDDSLAPKLPLELKFEEAGAKDCEGTFIWKEELAMYRSLYVEISDPQPDKEVEDTFEFVELFDVGEIKPPPEIKYPSNERWVSFSDKKITDYVTNGSLEHQVLDKIIFPTILLHETPCKLSSKDTYNLVREHVKRNINPKVARITSDYDFCFEVAKVIGMADAHEEKFTPIYHSGRRKPRVETRLVSTRQVRVFEMTSDKDKYGDYTVIDGFEGKTEADLKQQIDIYLEELMKYINEPLKDCPYCKGKGVVLSSEVEPVGAHKSEDKK